MPIVTSCPDCRRKLRVPDELLGKKVRCPGCKVTFTATADPDVERVQAPQLPPRQPAPAREERIEQEPRPRRAPPPVEEEHKRPRPPLPDEEEEDFEEDEEELPRGRRRHEDDEFGDENVPGPSGNRTAWRKVAKGITFILISIGVGVSLVIVGTIAGAILGMTAASTFGPPGRGGPPMVAMRAGTGFLVLTVIMFLFGLINRGIQLYGHYLGMAVPNKPGSGLKNLAIVTFGLYTAEVVLMSMSTVMGFVFGATPGMTFNPMASAGMGMVGAILQLLGAFCGLVGLIVFTLYLRGVALAVRRKELAQQLRLLLIIGVSLGAALILLTVVVGAVVGLTAFSASGSGGPPGGGAAAAMGGSILALGALVCFGGIAALGLGIWFVIVLFQLRGAVTNYARRA